MLYSIFNNILIYKYIQADRFVIRVNPRYNNMATAVGTLDLYVCARDYLRKERI